MWQCWGPLRYTQEPLIPRLPWGSMCASPYQLLAYFVISANTISLGMQISYASNWKGIHENNVRPLYFLTWFWKQKMVLVFTIARLTANARRDSLPVWRWLKKLTAQNQAAFLFKLYTPVLLSILVVVEDTTSSAEPVIYSCVSVYRSPSKDKLNSVAVPWKLMLWAHSFFAWKLVVSQAFAPWDCIHTMSLMISNPLLPSLFCGFKFFTILIFISPYEKAIPVSQMRKLRVRQQTCRRPHGLGTNSFNRLLLPALCACPETNLPHWHLR